VNVTRTSLIARFFITATRLEPDFSRFVCVCVCVDTDYACTTLGYELQDTEYIAGVFLLLQDEALHYDS